MCLPPLEIVFEIVDDPATFDDVFDEDSGDVVSSAGITGIAKYTANCITVFVQNRAG